MRELIAYGCAAVLVVVVGTCVASAIGGLFRSK